MKPYAHPEPEKVIKPLKYVSHGCGMQFEKFYRINKSVVAWFAHLQNVGIQPTFSNLGKCLWWQWCEYEAICPSTIEKVLKHLIYV
jgi:hypothetical protein